MKISEIRILIEPDIYNKEFHRVWVQIYPDINPNYKYGIQKVYPLDHLKSLFDMIWEDIGRELKEKMAEDENG